MQAGSLTRFRECPQLQSAAHRTTATSHSTAIAVASTLLVFCLSFALRVASPVFLDDQFYHLSYAHQITLGELPGRDFVDYGAPFQYYFSAVAQRLLGYNLVSELIMCSLFLSLGLALSQFLSYRASASLAISLACTLVAFLAFPRLYNYPKVLTYVLALLCMWQYIDRRSIWALLSVGLVAAFAFLLRHDHLLYIGFGAGVMILVTHWGKWRDMLVRGALLAALAAGILAPYFIFLQLNGGVVEHFRAGLALVSNEPERTTILPRPDFNLGDVGPVFEVRPPPSPRTAPVQVNWRAPLDEPARADFRGRYGLTREELRTDDPTGRSARYELTDLSRDNIVVLLKDPRIESVEGLDTQTLRATNPREEPFYVGWQRDLPILRFQILPHLLTNNAEPWLFHMLVSIPVGAIVLAILHTTARGGRVDEQVAWVICAVGLCLVVTTALLRRPLPARIPDVVALTVILGAWLLAKWLRRGDARGSITLASARAVGGRVLRVAIAVGVLAITTVSIAHTSQLDRRLDSEGVLRAGLASGPDALITRGQDMVRRFASPPLEFWAPRGSTGLRGLVRYLHECTRPTDRVLVTWSQPEIYYYANRGFAGGRAFFLPRLMTSEMDQQKVIDTMQRQSVPIVLGDMRVTDDAVPPATTRLEEFESSFATITNYLAQHYRTVAESAFGGEPERIYRVMVHTGLTPSGTDSTWALPCFAG